jgi:hypothetical protein
MKRRILAVTALLTLAITTLLLAAYTYYVTEGSLPSFNASKWYQENNSFGTMLVSSVVPPNSSWDYEVKTTFAGPAWQSGVMNRHFLRTNPQGGSYGNGWHLRVENYAYNSYTCQGGISLYKQENPAGSPQVTLLASAPPVCEANLTMRSVVWNVGTSSIRVVVYVNGVAKIDIPVQWDFQVSYGPAGTTTAGSTVAIGSKDTTAPNNVTGLTASVINSTTVNLQWNAASDDANGIGVWAYKVYKNGAYHGTTTSAGINPNSPYIVSGLSAGTQYTFTVYAVDSCVKGGVKVSHCGGGKGDHLSSSEAVSL